MKNITVTVVLPVKNEESNLPKCLGLLADFDQVMVIDSGSTDATPDIALQYGVEFHQFHWNGHFPKKRNWVLRNLEIRNEWVLFLDADEFITEEFKTELRQKIKENNFDAFMLSFHNYFMGKLRKYGDPFRKVALFRLGKGEYERVEEEHWSCLDMEVHEKPIIDGKIGLIKSPIIHKDYKNLDKYIARHNDYSTWEARRYYSLEKKGFENLTARQILKYKLMRYGFLPLAYFFGSYIWRLGFLDGKAGFYYHLYRMHYFLQIQNKIQELSSREEKLKSRSHEKLPAESEGKVFSNT